MFSKKAEKIDEIFTFYLPPGSKRQMDGEDFVNFCGLLRKRELKLFFGQASLVHPVGLVCITRENCSTQSKSLFPDVTLCSYAS